MTTPITAEIQSLSPSAIMEFFVLDMSSIQGSVLHFHAGSNGLQSPVRWQGVEYIPLPVETEGFDVATKGTLPRPRIRLANINGLFSAEIKQNDDLIGCKVIRKRTFARYLDAANFPGGVNADADPNQSLPDDVWFIDRKTAENRYIVEWELASAFDVQGIQLPFRQVIQNSCPWVYRSPECGFTGGYYINKNDQFTTSASEDYCSKRLQSCRARFGINNLPFGGFPGAHRIG